MLESEIEIVGHLFSFYVSNVRLYNAASEATRMSLELCVLASGSMGNCSVVRYTGGVMLIDLGIGPRTAAKRLEGTGVTLDEIRGVCLTHLDRDHFSPTWTVTLIKRQIPVFCHDRCADYLIRLAGDERIGDLLRPFEATPFAIEDGPTVHPIHLEHDDVGSHGFVVENRGARLGYATDLGRVPVYLLDRFSDLQILALESNYDRDMQMNSDRPWFLKQRIMGGRGHLSNHQSLDATRAILDRCQRKGKGLPSHIVLLHRSQQCNCPRLLRQFFSKDARIAPRLVLAEQDQRTDWIRPREVAPSPGEQLMLAWG